MAAAIIWTRADSDLRQSSKNGAKQNKLDTEVSEINDKFDQFG